MLGFVKPRQHGVNSEKNPVLTVQDSSWVIHKPLASHYVEDEYLVSYDY